MSSHRKTGKLFCRTEVGGCGKEILIISAKTDWIFGGTRAVNRAVRRAIHADELTPEHELISAEYSTQIRLRRILEDSCKDVYSQL